MRLHAIFLSQHAQECRSDSQVTGDMFLRNALLQSGVALAKLEEAFFCGLVKLGGDAQLVKFITILSKDTEEAFKLRNGLKEFFQLW